MAKKDAKISIGQSREVIKHVDPDLLESSRISGDETTITGAGGQTDRKMTDALRKSRQMSRAQVEALHAKFAAERAKKKQLQ